MNLQLPRIVSQSFHKNAAPHREQTNFLPFEIVKLTIETARFNFADWLRVKTWKSRPSFPELIEKEIVDFIPTKGLTLDWEENTAAAAPLSGRLVMIATRSRWRFFPKIPKWKRPSMCHENT